jgi:hypothetical protein
MGGYSPDNDEATRPLNPRHTEPPFHGKFLDVEHHITNAGKSQEFGGVFKNFT